MAKIPELTADMEVIQKLGRRPNVDDGLTEAGFKAKFDEAGIAIKKFINEKVVPAINDYVVSTDGLLDRTGGTMTGNIAMSGNKVTGLGAPSDNADAANKGYVDTALNGAKTVSVSATLTVAGWTGSTAPYTQQVTVSALTGDKFAMAYPVYDSDVNANLALKEACGMVSFASRGDHKITFTCLEDKPTVDIPIAVEVYV